MFVMLTVVEDRGCRWGQPTKEQHGDGTDHSDQEPERASVHD